MGTGFVTVENLFRRYPPGEHPFHPNPFFIRVIREIRGSNCCNPWFQLLFLGLIPMKSQASTNSVLRPCPRFGGACIIFGGVHNGFGGRGVSSKSI